MRFEPLPSIRQPFALTTKLFRLTSYFVKPKPELLSQKAMRAVLQLCQPDRQQKGRDFDMLHVIWPRFMFSDIGSLICSKKWSLFEECAAPPMKISPGLPASRHLRRKFRFLGSDLSGYCHTHCAAMVTSSLPRRFNICVRPSSAVGWKPSLVRIGHCACFHFHIPILDQLLSHY